MVTNTQAMTGLSRSIELLQQAQKAARIGAWELLAGEEKAFWTDGMFSLLEIKKTADNQMPLDVIYEYMHPDDAEQSKHFKERPTKNGEYELNNRWVTAKGKLLHVHCWVQSFFDDKGQFLKIRGTCQDISSFTKLETELERKTAALMRAEEMAQIGSYHVNFTAGETFYSDNMYRIYGYEPGEVPAEEKYFSPMVHPEDIDRVAKRYEERQQSDHQVNFRIVKKDGRIRHLQTNGRFYQNEKGEQILEGTTKDVTEWQLMEDELERQNDMLQQAEDTAQLGSWKYNFDTKQVFYSDSLYKLFGYTVREFENNTEKIFEHLVAEDVPFVLETYRKTIADGVARSADFRLKTADGAMRHFTSHGKLSTNRKGEKIIIGTVQDITEQYLLNKKLAAQNNFVQNLLDSSVNCILVTDKEKRYTLWNKRCEQLYGHRKEDVVGKTIREVYKDHDVTWIEEGIDRALRGEQVKIGEWHSDLTKRFYEVHFIPLKNADDVIDQVFIMMHDITQLKTLNENSDHQKKFAEAVIDHSEACIFIFDKDLRYVTWNKKCECYYGFPKEQVIGKTLQEVFPDADMLQPMERLQKALQGQTHHYPAEPSGILDKYYDSYIIPMKDKDGNVTSILCLLNDVTDIFKSSLRIKEANRLLEQKKKELTERTNFLETVLNATTDFIGVYDRNLRIVEINKSSLASYNLKRQDVLGKAVTELFPEIKGTVQLDNLIKALDGIATTDYEFSSGIGDKTFVGSQIPIRDHNNEVFAAVTIGHDITDIKKTMQALEELNNQFSVKNNELNRINSELASFSYVASHDLQEPLRKIQAFISLILVKDFSNLSESAKDYFKRIQASANRMQQMIDGLLSFSRTNTTARNFEERELKDVIKKVTLNMQDTILDKDAVIDVDVSHKAKIIPHQFEQLLEHIIDNALKFQPEGNKPHISITSNLVAGKDIEGEVAQRNKNYCRISIKDNGVGFDMEDAEKIFQMFHRLHGKSEYPGTGIGLAICRRIAQNHDGFITTESRPGDGATFHIYLLAEN